MSRSDKYGLVHEPAFVAWRRRSGHWDGWESCGASDDRTELRARFPDLLILAFGERPYTSRVDAEDYRS